MPSPLLAQSFSGLTFTTLNAVIYTVCFLVPGFLMDWAVSRFFYKRTEQIPFILLRCLTGSCINYLPWLVVYLLLWNQEILENLWFLVSAFVVVIFVSPLGIGFFWGYVNQQQLVERVLSILGVKTLSGFPSAWDYQFRRINDPVWILVTLKDGSRVAGKFGKESFASSLASDRDLFIESVYQFSEENIWQPVPQSFGIWINAEEIRYIEFWNDQME